MPPPESAVLVSRAAAAAIKGMSRTKARSALEAIERIEPGAGTRVRIPGNEQQYWAVVPSGKDAPVVIYRELAPAEGPEAALVVALLDRREFEDYQEAERRGRLDTRTARLLLDSARERA
jgi:hypothetical protein